MDTRAFKAGLIPLFLSVPPMFERCLGYREEGRFVAFFWEYFDELCYRDDLLDSGTLDSASWQLFMQHPFVKLHLRSFDLGSADFSARHWLLLDRDARRFFAGEKEVVEAFLEAEACPVDKLEASRERETTITLDEFISMAGNIEEVLNQELFPEELMKRLQHQQAVCSEMREWLERLG